MSDTPSDSTPFDTVRENDSAVETLTDRDDRIGAAARIILALSYDEQPATTDLEAVGIPVGPIGDFENTESEE